MSHHPREPFHELPADSLLPALDEQRPFVLLETVLPSPGEARSYLFLDPVEILTARDGPSLRRALERLDEAAGEGLWAAGYICYEAGALLDPALAPRRPERPLLWFGLFREPFVFDHRQGRFSPALPFPLPTAPPRTPLHLGPGEFSLDRQSYSRAVASIKRRIADGDTYQVNFTMRYRFTYQGPASHLYLGLRDNQPVPYAAWIAEEGRDVLSASPELFFRRRDDEITVRPMKGTSRRGRTPQEDALLAARLVSDPKNRAENVMIVDLVRNDLGRICIPGTVEVSELFRVEPYDTVLQMTSEVRGKLGGDISTQGLLEALFPCGSVTGAPKISTMQIIESLETQARGVFCGAIGYFSPRRRSVMNVPIRTVELQDGKGEMGVGSGIVADSAAMDEYDECLLKARFLTGLRPPLRLFETIGWRRSTGFLFLEEHLARLARSASFFSVPCPERLVRSLLEKTVARLEGGDLYRVRVVLSRSGAVEAGAEPVITPPVPLRVSISPLRSDSADLFLYHKTTRRELYDRELARAEREGLFELLFLNEKGEVTEGCFTNVFVRLGGTLLTPPVESGLLDGVLRRHLLEAQADQVCEAVLSARDLEHADAILVGNSVRGLMEVCLVPAKDSPSRDFP